MSYNRKLLRVDNRTSEMKNPNKDEQSKMGYRDDSPYRNLPSMMINTPNGVIDMSAVGVPILANGLLLPPYSGQYQFDTNQVLEEKMKWGGKMKEGGWLDQYQTGGSKPIASDKALAILENGSVYGKPLTEKQYNYFTKVAGVKEDADGNFVSVNTEDISDEDENMMMRYGGSKRRLRKNPKKTTHLNIQTSINDMFLRNEKLYGPGGLRRYLPKAEFGGWLDSYQNGGTNQLEGDLISKVLMERNKNKDFVKRAMYPNRTIQYNPDMSVSTHLMRWGEDDSGQAWMLPSIFNPNRDAIKVPNQYADYISNEGYKKSGWLDNY